jgi:prepilin-type N-terminal cleavage/methylation domain-containing protein
VRVLGVGIALLGVVTNVTSNQRGYSFLEIIVAVAVLSIMFGLATGITMTAVNATKSDSATGALMNVLELARNQATSQRRDFQLVFTNPNQIEVFRLELPTGSTLIMKRFLENGQSFNRFTGVPDTPDAFGHSGAVAFGSTPTIRFTSDGSLIDSSGDVLNGTLFVGVPNQVGSARAVTIFGATGLIRSWRWQGSSWVN